MEEKKYKKILRIMGKISLGLLVTLLVVLCFITCNTKKTKAEEIDYNYLEYNAIVSIDISGYNNGIYSGYYTQIANITNNEIEYVDTSLHTTLDFECDDANLLSGPYETYGATEIEQDKIYFVKIKNDTEFIQASEINKFYNYFNGEMYNSGYANGINTTEVTNAYNQGKQQGIEETQQQYQRAIKTQQEQYNQAIDNLNEEITRLETQVNNQNVAWGNYKSLLGLVVTYPIQFFKEGFDVNIFGVNVGGFIVGVGMLLIILSLIGLIFGRKVGGE